MQFLREHEVVGMTRLSRSTLWRREKKGLFPKRRQVGANSVRWIRTEVERWVESRTVA